MHAEAPTVVHDAPLRALNTFGIDARARRLVRLDDPAHLADAVTSLRDTAGLEPLVLGGGSNLLLSQEVVQRPVLHVRLRGRRVIADAGPRDTVIVEAGAGEPWDPFVRWTLAQGLAGLENLALIPGTVGAAPIQNIGAYGVELRERFESLDAFHLARGERRRFDAADCAFAYRDSTFKRDEGRGWLVLAVRFRLPHAARGALCLDYGEVRDELAARGIASAAPTDVADAVAAIRQRKLPDPAVLGNAGSFFKNPVVDAATASMLKAREPQLPTWPTDGGTKLAAGWLIERCGWKGHRRGDAGVHERHALVLVNHGNARGADLLALAHDIQRSVDARFGIRLEPEPVIV